MTKIEIICGTYGYRPDGSKHPIPIDRGGICEVSEEEAQRLFALCVARPAEETPSPAVATPPAGEDGSGAGADPSSGDEGAEDAESAHLDPEQLRTLTNAKLTELAKEMGIDTAKLKTKAQLIAAITDVPLEDGGIGSTVRGAVQGALGDGSIVVPLYVDGVKLGEAAIRGINRVTRSAGRVLLEI